MVPVAVPRPVPGALCGRMRHGTVPAGSVRYGVAVNTR